MKRTGIAITIILILMCCSCAGKGQNNEIAGAILASGPSSAGPTGERVVASVGWGWPTPMEPAQGWTVANGNLAQALSFAPAGATIFVPKDLEKDDYQSLGGQRVDIRQPLTFQGAFDKKPFYSWVVRGEIHFYANATVVGIYFSRCPIVVEPGATVTFRHCVFKESTPGQVRLQVKDGGRAITEDVIFEDYVLKMN